MVKPITKIVRAFFMVLPVLQIERQGGSLPGVALYLLSQGNARKREGQ